MNETENVATVLEQLRLEVRSQHAASAANQPGGGPRERELRHCAEQLEITRVVSAHWPIEGRNTVEHGIAFINKVVRRYLRWYINPIVEQQNAFNDVSARALRLLIAENAALRAEIAALKARQEEV
ncbi:hypothetical protein HC891_01335 [Candidatus Gracilibacteria bacterium]|nr:hypothetical protein [Candidatus Gracilibacteria bacterium]